jgi:hypothetical protein
MFGSVFSFIGVNFGFYHYGRLAGTLLIITAGYSAIQFALIAHATNGTTTARLRGWVLDIGGWAAFMRMGGGSG